jgi:hypothetical protein
MAEVEELDDWRVRTLSWPTSALPARVILCTDQFVLGGPIRWGAASAGEANRRSARSSAVSELSGMRMGGLMRSAVHQDAMRRRCV